MAHNTPPKPPLKARLTPFTTRVEKALTMLSKVTGKLQAYQRQTGDNGEPASVQEIVKTVASDMYETIYTKYTSATQLNDSEDYEVVSANVDFSEYENDQDWIDNQLRLEELNKYVDTLEPRGRAWMALVRGSDYDPEIQETVLQLCERFEHQAALHYEAELSRAAELAQGAEHDEQQEVDGDHHGQSSHPNLVQQSDSNLRQQDQPPPTSDHAPVEHAVKHIDTLDQIERDLHRTYPSIDYFRDPDVLHTLKRVLIAIACKFPKVGYVQGMNFVVAFSLMHNKTEDDCLDMISYMINDKGPFAMQLLYAEGLPNLINYNLILIDALREMDPELFEHLDQIGMGSLYFVHNWIMTLFAYKMPFTMLTEVWEYLFQEKWEGFFQVALALIVSQKSRILNLNFEGCSTLMKQVLGVPPADLVETAKTLVLPEDIVSRIRASLVEAHADAPDGTTLPGM